MIAARKAVQDLVAAGHLDAATGRRIVTSPPFWAMAHQLQETAGVVRLDATSTLRHAVRMLGSPTDGQVRSPARVLYARLRWLADPTQAPPGPSGYAADARAEADSQAMGAGGQVIDGEVARPSRTAPPRGRADHGRGRRAAYSTPPSPHRSQGTDRGAAPRRGTSPPQQQRKAGPRHG